MNKSLNTIIGAVALSAMLPAFAGPDWQAIEQARKNKREQVAQAEQTSPEAKCAAKRLVLPLDHGAACANHAVPQRKTQGPVRGRAEGLQGSGGQRGRQMSPRRRRLGTAMALALGGIPVLARAGPPLVEVWKGPACDCCKDWVKHLEANGFQVKTHDTGNTEARARLGMPVKYGACHTGQVAGYALEGHVPARDVLRLLKERPAAVGLAVPGMPRGSPGMDGLAYRGQRDPFDVLLVLRDGSASSYQSYR